MPLGITIFRWKIEESTKGTEKKRIVRKGRRETAKSDAWKTEVRENFRMEKVSKVTSCRKLSK